MMIRSPKHSLSALRRTVVLVALCVVLPSGSALAFFGGFSGIVFDPANFAENLRQAAALVQQIDRAATQIRLQRRMLAELPASVAEGLRDAASELHQQLSIGTTQLGMGHAGDGASVDSRYSISHAEFAPSWLDDIRPSWTRNERTSLRHEREYSARVQEQMLPTSQRITVLIEASNGTHQDAAQKPGEMAVLHAHEELLALCSGELDKLLGLRGLRARRELTDYARQQATAAYQTGRRQTLMNNWDRGANKPSRVVRAPFGL